MSEAITFNITTPTGELVDAYEIAWYQGDNGLTWDTNPVDTILVSNLAINPETGYYIWESDLANAARYHNLRTRTELGVESKPGIILAPKLSIDADATQSIIEATRVSDGSDVYNIGETISLMLDVDKDMAPIIGDTITVHILDPFNNVLEILQADLVGDSLYNIDYTIPKNLNKIYNQKNESEESLPSNLYLLKDRWVFQDESILEFGFKVKRASYEQPITDNSILKISFSNIEASDGSILEGAELSFTTHLTPYYCSVADIDNIYQGIENNIDKFTIVRNILQYSQDVNFSMKPDVITYQDRYDNAVRHYVAYSVASRLFGQLYNTLYESKSVEGFSVAKKYSYKTASGVSIEDSISKYANIILAGGKDTPYTSKTFIKGLNDPNRPGRNRANLDISDSYPWVNTTTSSTIITASDGTHLEIAGNRTIGIRLR